jgi:hypothetical protein
MWALIIAQFSAQCPADQYIYRTLADSHSVVHDEDLHHHAARSFIRVHAPVAPRMRTRIFMHARAKPVYSSGATKLIGLVGGPTADRALADSDELSSKDGR